jgi:hypothetical protein
LSSTGSSRDDDDDKKIKTKATAILGHWQAMRMCLLAAFASAPFFFLFFDVFSFPIRYLPHLHIPSSSVKSDHSIRRIASNESFSLSLAVINFPFYRLSFFVLFVFSFTLSHPTALFSSAQSRPFSASPRNRIAVNPRPFTVAPLATSKQPVPERCRA